MSFQAAAALTRVSDGRFRASIPDGWQQGRGAFGGLVIGLLAGAARAVEPEGPRVLRTLTADVYAPVLVGDVEVRAEVMRRGANLTNVDVRLEQQGAVVAHASTTLGTARSNAVPLVWAPAAPEWSDWRALAPLPIEPPIGPVFGRHYEFRSAGPMPFSGSSEPRTEGFIREKGRTEPLDTSALIALLDAFWPTLYSIEKQPRAVATVSFTAELLVDPSTLPGAEPLKHRARLAVVREGFMTEFRELWSGEQLVAMNQQTMALLR